MRHRAPVLDNSRSEVGRQGTEAQAGRYARRCQASSHKAVSEREVSGWSKELEDGKTTYEVSVIEGSSKRDVVFAEDGSLVAIEESIQVFRPACRREKCHSK